MRSILKARTLLLLVVIAMLSAACAAEEPAEDAADEATEAVGDTTAEITEEADDVADEATEETDMSEEDMDAAMTEGATEGDVAANSAEACDADALVAAVEGGAEEGTLSGMADDPVGTAASNNPVLTTLVTAVSAAGLVDTLNSAEALTVFAPTDCAFAEFDPATLEAALADPEGLLTTVLGYHVIAGEQIASADLSGEYETFTGETITVEGTDVDGQATILVPDVMTANATVHLIDTVMVPPSVSGGADAGAEATEEGTEG